MRKAPGFMLLEILFTVFIIQVVVAVLSYYAVGIAAANFSAIKTQAAYVVHNKMEEIRAGQAAADGSESKVLGRQVYKVSWYKEVIETNADRVLFKIYVKADYHTVKGPKRFESATYHVSGLPTAPQW